MHEIDAAKIERLKLSCNGT